MSGEANKKLGIVFWIFNFFFLNSLYEMGFLKEEEKEKEKEEENPNPLINKV